MLGAATVSLGIYWDFSMRLSSAGTAVRQQPMMTKGPANQGAALSAPLASLLTAQKWLNTQPPRPEQLRGKVVLVNFWTPVSWEIAQHLGNTGE
jgi:hypothetical protein